MLYYKNEYIKKQLGKILPDKIENLSIDEIAHASEQANLTFGYLDSNNQGEIKLALVDSGQFNYVYLDSFGEIEESKGDYKRFEEDLNSSVTELENKMVADLKIILNHDLDVICLGKLH